MSGGSSVNTEELESALGRAELRVLKIQTKLHRWAREEPHRRFDDLFNLVADPAFLLVAWDRVRGNKGARTAGVDGQTADYVQAALKLVLEPIWEADFLPCSYGFRPGRRAHDAIAETVMFVTNSYEWVVEGDITACFDEISHSALMGRVRQRIGDKRVLALVKAFLKAGILTQDGTLRDSRTGAPQGGILSPLLSNVALSVLDEHIAQIPGGPSSTTVERAKRKRHGQ